MGEIRGDPRHFLSTKVTPFLSSILDYKNDFNWFLLRLQHKFGVSYRLERRKKLIFLRNKKKYIMTEKLSFTGI